MMPSPDCCDVTDVQPTVNMYISRASNFRDLSKIGKLNTLQIFGIAHHRDFVCIEYQLFRDMILVLYNINNNTGRNSIITFV